MTTVAELERELAADTAAAYGIDVEKLRLIDLDMRRLAEQCILIHVRIEGVSQFRKAVPWELLGIAQKDVRRENITKGVLSYWPIAAVRSLESQEEVIRQCLKRFGHDIDGFAPFTCVRRGEGSAEDLDEARGLRDGRGAHPCSLSRVLGPVQHGGPFCRKG